MKSIFFKSALVLFIITFFFSCSRGDDNEPNSPSKGTFSLNTYSYQNDGSLSSITAKTSEITGRKYVVGQCYSILRGNSPYTVRFEFTFNSHSAGTYLLKKENTRLDNENEKYMDINVIIVDENFKSSSYTTADTNIIANVTLIDGKLHISIPNEVVITKDSNGNNHPNSFTFKCNDIH